MTRKRTNQIATLERFRVVEDLWQTLDRWDSSGYRVEGPWIEHAELNAPFPAGSDGSEAALQLMREEAARIRPKFHVAASCRGCDT